MAIQTKEAHPGAAYVDPSRCLDADAIAAIKSAIDHDEASPHDPRYSTRN